MATVDPQTFGDWYQYINLTGIVSLKYTYYTLDENGNHVNHPDNLANCRFRVGVYIYKTKHIQFVYDGELLRVSVSDIIADGDTLTCVPGTGSRVTPKSEQASFYPPSATAYVKQDGVTEADAFFRVLSGLENYMPDDSQPASRELDGGQDIAEHTAMISVQVGDQETPPKSCQVPFCVVTAVEGRVYRIDSITGQKVVLIPGARLFLGAELLGEVISGPGTTFIYPAVGLRFSNGVTTYYRLFDKLGQAIGIKLGATGPTSLGRAQSSCDLDLHQVDFDLTHQPREAAKTVVGNIFGYLAGALSSGWGWVSKGLIKWGVNKAIDNLSTGPRQKVDALHADLTSQANDIPSIGSPPPMRADMSVLSDGTVRLVNWGSSLVVGDDSKTYLLPTLTYRDFNTETGAVSAGPLPASPSPPSSPLNLQITPADGSHLSTGTPVISVAHNSSDANHLVYGLNLICRLNGTLITPFMQTEVFVSRFAVPEDMSLSNGENRLKVKATTNGGVVYRAQAVYDVDAPLAAPRNLSTKSGQERVGLYWSSGQQPNLQGYQVWRSTSSGQSGQVLGTTQQPVFFDNNPPQGTVYYQVAALSSSGAGEKSRQVSASLQTSPARSPVPVTNLLAEPGDASVNVSFDDPRRFNFAWKIERATSETGPFSNPISGQGILGVKNFVDRNLSNGTPYWYRITPVNADGKWGSPQLVGPVTPVNLSPPVPTGLTADLDGLKLTLEWDPAPNFADISYYKIWRAEFGGAFQPVKTVTAGSRSTQLDQSFQSLCFYRITAVDPLGLESDPSQPAEASSWGLSYDVIYVNGNDETCGGKTPCYTSIQDAIDAASTYAVIRIAQGTYTESISLNASKTVTLKGGWDPSFKSPTGITWLTSAPKAPKGSLTLQTLTIKP